MLSRPFENDILEMVADIIGPPLGYRWRDRFVGRWVIDTTEALRVSMWMWAC